MDIRQLVLVAVFASVALVACTKAPLLGSPVKAGSIPDGEYEGTYKSFPNSAKVRVLVEKGRIAHVVILRAAGSWKGAVAENVIPERIVDEQSTDVDAVVGATNSSYVIMNAAQNALDKAVGSGPTLSADEPE